MPDSITPLTPEAAAIIECDHETLWESLHSAGLAETNPHNREAIRFYLDPHNAHELTAPDGFQQWCREVWEDCDDGAFEATRLGTLVRLYRGGIESRPAALWVNETHAARKAVG